MYNFKHNENGNTYYKVSYIKVYGLFKLSGYIFLFVIIVYII